MPAPTRRAILLGAAALPAVALAGCSSEEVPPQAVTIEPTSAPEPDPNVRDELVLVGAYAGAIAAFPDLRGTLAAIADQHRAHARELGVSEEDLAGVEPIAPNAKGIPAALTELIKRERAAAGLRVDSAESASDPADVRVLTYIAASEASHVPELQDVRKSVKADS